MSELYPSPLTVDLVAEPSAPNGGIARYVRHLQAALVDSGVDARLMPFRYLPGATWRPVLKAIPIGISQRRPESIIHIPQIMGASVLLKPHSWPAVVTVHGLGILGSAQDRAMIDWVSQQLIRLSMKGLKRADHLIAVSDFTRDSLIQAGFSPERITTVYEGVDGRHFRPIPDARKTLKDRYGIDTSTRPTLLYVGNEFARKNLVSLVQAIGMLRRAGTDVRWLKVGSAGYAAGRQELLRAINREGLDEVVTIMDHVPEGDLPLFYSAADMYVQPSLWEGFGLPVLEAMACGVPVVSSDAGSLPEICGGAAVMTNARSVQALANAIGDVIQDSHLAQSLRERGLQRATQFTWGASGRATEAIYRGLIA